MKGSYKLIVVLAVTTGLFTIGTIILIPEAFDIFKAAQEKTEPLVESLIEGT